MRPTAFRTDEGERGAVLIITALLVPALVAVAALALGTTTLWTSRQDLQRSADLAALAGASATPTVSTDFPITGVHRSDRLDALLDGGVWDERPCAVAQRQLADGRSPIANAFRADPTAPTCEPEWQWESPLLATLAACAADIAELAGCRAGLDAELRADLPAIDALDASTASAVAEVHALVDQGNRLVDAALATQLADACVAETGVTVFDVTAWVCEGRVGDLLAAIDHRTGAVTGVLNDRLLPLVGSLSAAAQAGLLDAAGRGLGFAQKRIPQVGVDIGGVAPAVLTPRVEVALSGLTMRPALSPVDFDVVATATARRVIKSALVLPMVGVPGVEFWGALPPRTQAAMQLILGPRAEELLARAEDGWVIDPNIVGESAPGVAARVLNLFDRLEGRLSTTTSDALCTALPPTIACPVADDLVDREHLLGPFMEDVWDATRPPPHGSAPTVQQILERHADTGEPLYVIGGMRAIRPGELFGSQVWETLVNPQSVTEPAVSALLSELMLVPALDVVPATIVRDGDRFRVERALAMTGLYKARLVR